MTVVAPRLNGPQVPVPEQDALPEDDHPENVEPPVAVAVQAPIEVPAGYEPVEQFVPVMVPVPLPAVATVRLVGFGGEFVKQVLKSKGRTTGVVLPVGPLRVLR